MHVRAPTCAAVCIVGQDCVVEFIKVATDAFNALLWVALLASSALSVVLPLQTIVLHALSLSTSFIFLFLCSGDLIAFGMFNYFFFGSQFYGR
jgi:hypothetical protein